jgi:hypothetical protein
MLVGGHRVLDLARRAAEAGDDWNRLMHIDTVLRRLPSWSPALARSLYDVVPYANLLPRSLPRADIVPVEAITGTVRHPSNTTADFLPIGPLRTPAWHNSWQRILDGYERMAPMPPVDLIKVGSWYFVVDGHKRVAAARKVGAALDAIVVELHLPETTATAA